MDQRRNDRAYHLFVWWPIFLAVEVMAFGVVLAVDPAGFDACEAVSSTATSALQAGIASTATVGAVGLAVRRLRGRLLAAALVPVAISALVWVWLLAGPQSC